MSDTSRLVGRIGLALYYDVTTVYVEAEKGMTTSARSATRKNRRVAPQIVVGLLVDRAESLLVIGCLEGNRAVTHTIVPIIRQFQDRHDLAGVEMVVAADALACTPPTTSSPSTRPG